MNIMTSFSNQCNVRLVVQSPPATVEVGVVMVMIVVMVVLLGGGGMVSRKKVSSSPCFIPAFLQDPLSGGPFVCCIFA